MLPDHDRTDFQSLLDQPDYDAAAELARQAAAIERKQNADATDFHTLAKTLETAPPTYQHRTATDFLIDALVPPLIFLMMAAVVFYLLDVRFIFTEKHDANLRVFSLCLLLGIVAINRLVATEGSDESILYIAVFAGAAFMYTLFTTSVYDVGSVARGFLDDPWINAFFNMSIVGLLWWVTNRLVHECSIDENRTAGDVGILTGTARNIQKAIKSNDAPIEKTSAFRNKPKRSDSVLEMNELEAFDPLEWEPEQAKRTEIGVANKRLAQRHPGISVLYLSAPVMIIFALGLPVLRQGGERWVATGHVYVGVYTLTALYLLLITSLGGLREYFRSRHVPLPAAIGWWWIGLGSFMIVMVALGAAQLPMPEMPAAAQIQEHETDWWRGESTFELQHPASEAAEAIYKNRVLDRVGQGVLIILGAFGLYALLRIAANAAAVAGRNRDLLPAFLVRFFNRLDAFLQRFVNLPESKPQRGRRRVPKAIAKSIHYKNPMGDERYAAASFNDHVAISYDALCALARDLGVPRHIDQTPYEFIDSLPKELEPLRDEARELTTLFVQSAYSDIPMDAGSADRLRKFWMAFEQVRKRVVR